MVKGEKLLGKGKRRESVDYKLKISKRMDIRNSVKDWTSETCQYMNRFHSAVSFKKKDKRFQQSKAQFLFTSF